MLIHRIRNELVLENKVVVDIGANIGVYSALALVYGKASKVIAIEGHPDLSKLYMENMVANGIDSKIQLIPKALIGYAREDCRMSGNVYNGCAKVSCDGVPVETILISELYDLLKLETAPIHLKMDIEGGEWELFETDEFWKVISLTHTIDLEVHFRSCIDIQNVPEIINELKSYYTFNLDDLVLTGSPDEVVSFVSRERFP